MSDYFLKLIRKQIIKDANKKLKVVGYGDNDYFLGYATSPKELTSLLRNEKLVGIVTDNTPRGSVCYDIKKQEIYLNKQVLTEADVIEYETEQLLLAGGLNKESMHSEITSNNRFAEYMANVFSEKEELVNLNQIYVEYNGYKHLPLFHSITVKTEGLDLCITKHQMSILTGSGLVKIHDMKRNIDSLELSELISNLFKTDKRVLYKVFSSLKVTTKEVAHVNG